MKSNLYYRLYFINYYFSSIFLFFSFQFPYQLQLISQQINFFIIFIYFKLSPEMSLKREKEKESREKNRSKGSTASNRSGMSNSTPYNQLRTHMQKLLQMNNNKKDQSKDSSRGRPKASLGNQNNIIKCFMNQPIVNNFISISQDQPVRIKTSLKQQKVKPTKQIQKRQFTYKYIIGKGGFGKVWKVEHCKTRNQFAMKEMLKSIVLTKKSVQSIINQQKLLSKLNSPFIVNMRYAFQDRETLYLVLDLMEGGDLRHHLSCKMFNQIQSKFFIACIILGLQYLHNNSIIHRDIKPQNLVLDNRGYIRITDLGIARVYRSQNSSDTSGTPGYMSPEVICRQNHSYVSDLFALGVIAHQLMLGKRPYNGFSRQQIRQNILAKQASVRPYQIPAGWSTQSMDFVNRLLQRRPEQRLGYRGIQQLKDHPWIQGLNWKALYKRQIQSPFIPSMKKSDFDQDQKITVEDEQQAELIEKNALLLRKSQFQELFKDYYFDSQEVMKQKQKINTSEQTSEEVMKRTYLQSAKSSTRQRNSKQGPNGLIANLSNLTSSIPFGKIKNGSFEKENPYLLKDYKL